MDVGAIQPSFLCVSLLLAFVQKDYVVTHQGKVARLEECSR